MRALALATLATTLILAAACSPHRVVETVAVLEDIARGAGDGEFKAASPEPRRRPTTFTVSGRTYEADLYEPEVSPAAGMVLVPGAAPRGRDDPRLVAFAKTLARARFEVLVPDLPEMRALRVSSDEAGRLADAVRYMRENDADRPLGMTAISFAAGPAVLALFERHAVDFLVLIGGYYDMEAAITFVTTGFFREAPDAPWRHRDPSGVAKWAFVLSNVGRIADPADRQAMTEMARRKMRDPEAEVSDLVAGLGHEGRSVHALLANRDPEQVPKLIAALPRGVRAEIEALDLTRRDLGDLDVSFVLVHGRDDPVIPATESIALARVLGPDRADLYVVEALRHVETTEPGFSDSLKLLRAVYRVLELRDGQ